MATKKKVTPVDPFQEYEQRLSKLEDQLRDLDEGVGHDLGIHDQLIDDLREDLVGRDKVIWVLLDQHNARIREIKHHIIGVVGEEDPEPKPSADTVVTVEETPLWFVILFWLGLAALLVVVVYGVTHFPN